MKWLLFSIALGFFTTTTNAQNVNDVVHFATTNHDFGRIKQNVPVSYAFSFTNKGKEKIIIEKTTASCGCTTPKKPEKPIQPGKTDIIQVQYNAVNKGSFNKQVNVYVVGYKEPIVLTIKGDVGADSW